MGVNQVCVSRHNTSTFSSDSDEKVFLCPHRMRNVKRTDVKL